MIPYRYTNLEEVEELTNVSQPIAFDLETDGFYGKICLAQFYQKGWDSVLFVKFPSPVVLYLTIRSWHLVAHGAMYEYTTIQRNLHHVEIDLNLDCTLLLARLYWPHIPKYSLDQLYAYLYSKDIYAELGINKKEYQKSNWNQVDIEPKQELYAALDVYRLLDVYDVVKAKLSDFSYKLDRKTNKRLGDMQRHGIPIEPVMLEAEIVKAQQLLTDIALPFNCNSYKQVRAALGGITESDDIGLAVFAKKTKDPHLAKLAQDTRTCRSTLKTINFCEKYLDEGTLVRGTFRAETQSGRTKSSEHNLQQWPRHLKGAIGFPNKDKYLIYADFEQLELRTIAAAIFEQTLVKWFKAFLDPHTEMAKELFHVKEPTKQQRQTGKGMNFTFLYVAGAKTGAMMLLKQYGVVLTVEETEQLLAAWFSRFYTVKKWHNTMDWDDFREMKKKLDTFVSIKGEVAPRGIYEMAEGSSAALWEDPMQQKDIQQNLLNHTPCGRYYSSRARTDYFNITNQGAGAEVAKMALCMIADKLKDIDGAELICFKHDDYLVQCDHDLELAKECAHIVAECMQKAWFKLTKTWRVPDVPMPVNASVGYNLAEIDGDGFKAYEHKLKGLEYV